MVHLHTARARAVVGERHIHLVLENRIVEGSSGWVVDSHRRSNRQTCSRMYRTQIRDRVRSRYVYLVSR